MITPRPRVGSWMQTYSGVQFYPLDPRPEEVMPLDIAHGLSMQCRYNGHVSSFYSVAEHCVKMSEAVSPENALWALLHDATESYIGDVITPVKRNLPAFASYEDHLMGKILIRFGQEPGPMPAEVKDADARILLTERAALVGKPVAPWTAIEHLDPLPVTIEAWSPEDAEIAYLNRLIDLVPRSYLP